ncbi:MAG: TetR family transcriptional regulator [Alphaproteobacteria bacterium]|nr:TetR family transcriptional regulator [Alphaproteobacteria bacterium]
MARRPRKRTGASDPGTRIVDAALELIPVHGWSRLTLARIARASGLTLADLHALYPSKNAILAAFMARIDSAMLVALADADAGASARDRLFEATMARLDALKPYREAVKRLVQDVARDPIAAVGLACRLRRSFALMLESADIGSGGLRGALRIKGLGLIHLATLRVWSGDESDDMAKTMAALDQNLTRAESIERWCGRLGRRADTDAMTAPA